MFSQSTIVLNHKNSILEQGFVQLNETYIEHIWALPLTKHKIIVYGKEHLTPRQVGSVINILEIYYPVLNYL
jgi:hypothetical protein